jgi:hypothetical protein
MRIRIAVLALTAMVGAMVGVAPATAGADGPKVSVLNNTEVTTLPQAPTILRNATAHNQAATVSWVAPAWDGNAALTGYVVTPYIGYFPLTQRVFSSTATTQVITGLTNGTMYRFSVRAVNAIGTGPRSKVTNPVIPAFTPPSVPTIGVATAGDSSATVSWTAPSSDGGSAILGYVVIAYVGFAPVTVRIFQSTTTTQTVTNLTNGTQYRFRVWAYNAIGASPISRVTNPATPTPTAPNAVIFDGQSLNLLPGGYRGATSYPGQTMASFSSSVAAWDVTAVGSASWTALGQEPIAASHRLFPYADMAPFTVLVMCGGTRDILEHDSGATVYADMESYADAARAAGFDYVIGTTITDSAIFGAAMDAARADANTAILADAGDAFDAVVDFGGNASLNANILANDGTHPDEAGAGIMAGLMATALDAVI